MQALEGARALARDIQESEEYKVYAQYKEELEADAGAMALVKEYQRLQMRAQLCAVSGSAMDESDMQRFSQMSTLLYADSRTSGYLLSQMRLQKLMADILQILTQAADLPMDLPQ